LFMYWNLDKVMEKEELEREAARQEKLLEPVVTDYSEMPYDLDDEIELCTAARSNRL
jgi:hypothetical protein